MHLTSALKKTVAASTLFFACLNTASATPFGDTSVITQGYDQVAHFKTKARLHRPNKNDTRSSDAGNQNQTNSKRNCIRYPRLPKRVSVYTSGYCSVSASTTAHTTQ